MVAGQAGGHDGGVEEERVLREGGANHQRGPETVGGHLRLTTRTLRFTPHRLNVQTEVTEYPVDAVVGARPVWTKVFGFLPLAPNSVAVDFADGSEQRFVVPRRGPWIEAILSAAREAGAPLR